MTLEQLQVEGRREFEEKFPIGDDFDYDKVISFQDSLIARAFEAGRKETEKAFGGCKNCYGKGYSTSIEFAQSYEDFGGEKTERVKLPTMRFCDCERGRQLSSNLTNSETLAHLNELRERLLKLEK